MLNYLSNIPLALLRSGIEVDFGVFSYLAFPFWIFGSIAILWCFWDFVQKGKGTPAPIDPPKELVASGLYRYVRNPMYVGVLSVIFGHILWFGHWSLLIYAFVIFTAFHLFVTLYEEPNLKRRFGASYEEYLRKVPRWIPRVRK
ncbi:MAG: isoprenylcysteine carboxylmethyltransferase family protein [Chloroflexi bacterium]|nr:isoprenylcysteine carboxylmethyltransferase family protein [Chloroflexota bacterium]